MLRSYCQLLILQSLVDRIEVKTECIEDYMSSYSYLFDKVKHPS